MQKILDFFKKDRFAAFCGIELIEVRPGYALAELELEAHHLNGLGTAQGGLLFTLADLAFAAACNSDGKVAVAINVSINFVRPVSEGRLKAIARECGSPGRVGTYRVDVTDASGQLVAAFQGLAYNKNQDISEVSSA